MIPDPKNPVLRQQIGQQSSKGVELTGAFELGAGLRVDANLAVLDARCDDFTELVSGTLTSWAGNTPTNKFYLQSVSGALIPLRGRIGPPRAVELMLNARF